MGIEPAAHALRWIAGVLADAGVPYQVVGGVAARAYGATRPIADIDLYVPGDAFARVLPHVCDYVVFGPAVYRDAQWDLTFMALDYQDRRVELGDADATRIYDRRAGRWRKEHIDFPASVYREVLGVRVPVMPRSRLIAYKRMLDRPVDRQDIAEVMQAQDATGQG